MPKAKKATKKRSKPKRSQAVELPSSKEERKTVSIEKADNGFIVSQTVSTPKDYKEKKFVATTAKEAKELAAKLI